MTPLSTPEIEATIARIRAGREGGPRILIACEYSATVRDAFRARGFDAWSCDLLPTEGDPRWHIKGDAIEAAYRGGWDAMIEHPVCTRMANIGSKHLYVGMRKENGREPTRWAALERDADFYRTLRDSPIRFKAVENSVMHGHAIELTRRGETQFIHPHFFGSPFFKLTGVELVNLPPLRRTHRLAVPRPGTDEHKAWSRCHRIAPGADRGKERARFDPAIAAAMAHQWGDYLRTHLRASDRIAA